MWKSIVLSFILSLLVVPLSAAQAASVEVCDESNAAIARWREIAIAQDNSGRDLNSLAFILASCLGSPNPELRDNYAYGLIAAWLRAGLLSDQTRSDLTGQLSNNLDADNALQRSFSALVLSEILRADNLSPLLSGRERLALLKTTIAALAAEDDYRGLTEEVGWIHPVAHLADMLWRFALHEETSPAEGRLILSAVRDKAATPTAGFIVNEGDRLARAAVVVIQRGLLPEAEVVVWIESFATPSAAGAGLQTWPEAFRSGEGLNELHNSKLVFRALAANLLSGEVTDSVRESLQTVQRRLAGLV